MKALRRVALCAAVADLFRLWPLFARRAFRLSLELHLEVEHARHRAYRMPQLPRALCRIRPVARVV
jgi:hypothetical protein